MDDPELGSETEHVDGDVDDAAGVTEAQAASLIPAWAQWTLLAAGLIVLALGVIFWRNAEPDPDVGRAADRDAVLVAATSNLETLQTMDYEQVDKHLAAWQDVSTGVLGDQFAELTDEDRQATVDSQARSTGQVLSIAVTELNERTATVIASIQTTVRVGDDPEESEKRNRFAADLVLVKGRWLVENLALVGVNLK